MLPISLKTFIHPHKVYRLEYPSHWDQAIEKDGESCGFGPHERNDVGLWISIMPMSLDTDKIQDHLPDLMQKSLEKSEAANQRPDPSLKHFGLVADMTKDGQGGHYWLLAGGDVVLFASTEVPAAERDAWNPMFQKVMSSLQITREDQKLERQVIAEILSMVRERHPEQEFEFDGHAIRGRGQKIFLGNVMREVRSAPKSRDRIIKHFVDNISWMPPAGMGEEKWEEVCDLVVPMLKPTDYIDPKGATQDLQTTEWLANVLICYVIKVKKVLRFVQRRDMARWGVDVATLHEHAMTNLAKLPWPTQMEGSRTNDGGRIILVDTDDSLGSSRLLHPELHRLFSGPLGSPFWAGIPCRDRLVVFSDRRDLKQRISRRLMKDYKSSPYPITPKPFLVTRDGIAPPTKN